MLSLLNVVLVFVPLVSIVFGTMYLYGARDFIELLLAQPVGRSALFAGLYGGLAAPLAAAFLLGVGLPFLWAGRGRRVAGRPARHAARRRRAADPGLHRARVPGEPPVRGPAPRDSARRSWSGSRRPRSTTPSLVLVAVAFGDRSLELPLIGLTLLNPVDLGRVLLLLQFDSAALMGYTGAVFERFFGSGLGAAITATALILWCAGPLGLALRRFRRQDF